MKKKRYSATVSDSYRGTGEEVVRPVRYFTDEYLEQCKGVTPEQALTFLEQYRQLLQSNQPVKFEKLMEAWLIDPLHP